MHLKSYFNFYSLIMLLLINLPSQINCFKRICYLLSENQETLIMPDQINWQLCTHLIFSFAHTDSYMVKIDNVMDQYMKQIISINQSEIYYSFSIGGSNFSFVDDLVQTEKFIDSIIHLMDYYQLDGVDLDWEFPLNQKWQFARLLKMIRHRFKQKTSHRGEPYLLSVALAPVIYIVEMSYDIHSIERNVDFVNIMTYDFHSPNTFPYTNFNAPLYANHLDMLYFKYFNIDFAISYLAGLGLSKKKIMVGIPFYGYKYFLVNEEFHGLYSLANGTEEPVQFNKICQDFLIDPDTTIVFDRESKVPYAYRRKEWITYDDSESIAIKAQWLADNNLGGSMTFSLNYDDYKGNCGSYRRYPLQSILYDILN